MPPQGTCDEPRGPAAQRLAVAGEGGGGSFAKVTTSDPPFPPISVALARRLAHALRTPIGVIDGVLSEISASPSVTSDPSVLRFAALGRRSVRQLVELAERLDWAGRFHRVGEEAAVVLDWPDVIRRCVVARSGDQRERGKKQIDVVIAEEVGAGRARREASERALIELLDNAIRNARTTVQVIADADGACLRLRVIDDGPGLPEGGAAAFAPPQQPGPRVGFGLWLAQNLATALHGSVSVERTGEQGTVMCLRLPLDSQVDTNPPG
jgi:signal transduction histidine kinase